MDPSGGWHLGGLVPQTKTFPPKRHLAQLHPGKGLKSSQCWTGGWHWEPQELDRDVPGGAGKAAGDGSVAQSTRMEMKRFVLCALCAEKASLRRGAGCVRVWEFRLRSSNLGCLEKSLLCI